MAAFFVPHTVISSKHQSCSLKKIGMTFYMVFKLVLNFSSCKTQLISGA